MWRRISDDAYSRKEEMKTVRWDRLLEWMTHVGSGPWDAFRQSVAELDERLDDDRQDLYRSLRIALSDLGHADFFVGGSRRWHVRRPALVGTSQSGREHMFTGGRTARLASELAMAAENAEALVTVERDDPALSRIHVQGDPARLATIAQDLGIDYLRNGASALVGLLPPISQDL